jgi:FdrA protein
MRDGALTEAVRDPQVGVILLDIILGYGAHLDPAAHVAGILARRDGSPLVIASVVGTDGDPQPRADQVRTLAEAGVIVAASSADAAEMAIRAIGTCDP